jgi:hypothetical protein
LWWGLAYSCFFFPVVRMVAPWDIYHIIAIGLFIAGVFVSKDGME